MKYSDHSPRFRHPDIQLYQLGETALRALDRMCDLYQRARKSGELFTMDEREIGGIESDEDIEMQSDILAGFVVSLVSPRVPEGFKPKLYRRDYLRKAMAIHDLLPLIGDQIEDLPEAKNLVTAMDELAATVRDLAIRYEVVHAHELDKFDEGDGK